MSRMKTMSSRPRLAVLFLTMLTTLLVVAGCYPGGPEDLGEIGLVASFKAPEGDFTGLQTYALPDTVLPLVNPDDDSSEPLSRQYDALILEEIAAQMEARGFERILDPDEENVPDVVVQVGAVQSDAYLVFSYWGYPGWGWGYPGYGWGYPGYPTYGAVKYKQGSIVWVMLDLRQLDPSDPAVDDAEALWVAGLNGALSGTGTNPSSDITSGIRQGFSQSRYIQADQGGR